MKPKLLSVLLGVIPAILGGRLHAASVVEFAVTNLTVTEYDGAHYGVHQVLLTRTPPMNRLVEVIVAPAGGSAKVGPVGCTDCDYKFSNGGTTGRGNFQAGEPSAVVNLVTRDDGLAEGDETIVLGLLDLPLGVVAGSRSNLVITLKNSGPSVGIGGGGSYEDEGNELNFLRIGDTNVAVTVHYAVAGGTATPGVDFQTALDGTVTFAPGEQTQRVTFNTRDGIVDAARREWFTVRLADPPPGVELFNREALIEIFDAQFPTTLDLSYIPPFQDRVYAVARRGDGKLAVVKYYPGPLELVLLNSDGSLDKKLPVSPVGPGALAWQADGKLLVAARDTQENSVFHRFLADGRRDSQFPGPVNLIKDWGSKLVTAADGAIYVFDPSSSELWRLKPDGTEDTGFKRPVIDSLSEMAVDVEGRIVFVGYNAITEGRRFGLNRLTLDGASIDASFVPKLEPDGSYIQKFVMQPNGKILVAGDFNAVNGEPHAGLARLNADGSTDDSFHYSASSSSDDQIISIAILEDGTLLFAKRDGNIQHLAPNGGLLRTVPIQVSLIGRHHEVSALTLVPLTGDKALIAGTLAGVNGLWQSSGLARVLLGDAPRTALAFTSSDLEGSENQGNIGVTVTRLGDVTAAARVQLTTRDRTAQAGEDYRLLTTTLEFAPFEQEKEVQIELLLDDHTLEGDETFELVLSDSTGAEMLGPPVEVTILDDEIGFLPGAITHRADGAVELVFQSVCCPVPVVEVSTDLIHWAPAQGAVEQLGNNRYRMVEEPTSDVPARFYRLRSPALAAEAQARPAF